VSKSQQELQQDALRHHVLVSRLHGFSWLFCSM
jgi:hypothetical protein